MSWQVIAHSDYFQNNIQKSARRHFLLEYILVYYVEPRNFENRDLVWSLQDPLLSNQSHQMY